MELWKFISMYHGKHLKKLGRKTTQHRMDMLKNMVSSLIKHERIETTYVKAKSMQRLADKMVTHIKKNNTHSENICKDFVREHDITIPKLKELAERFKDRNGGYTRVFKNGNRHGDNAPMGIIEYIGGENDLKAFITIKAEARRRVEKENKDFKTSQEIHDFLLASKEKGSLLDKKEFLRLKNQQKAMLSFERRIEKVKNTLKLDDKAWEAKIAEEVEFITKKADELKVSA